MKGCGSYWGKNFEVMECEEELPYVCETEVLLGEIDGSIEEGDNNGIEETVVRDKKLSHEHEVSMVHNTRNGRVIPL